MSVRTQPGSILLVEDEPTLQRILGSVLGDAGHRVEAVGTAEHAIERLEDGDFDLVLTDKNLPKMNGLELLAELRAWERGGRKPIGVMMVTGYPSRDTALQALADDADGYLVKPFRSLTHAVDQVQVVLGANLRARREAQRRARVVARALGGLPEDLVGQTVAVLGVDHAALALRKAGAVVVGGGGLERAGVVVAATLQDIAAAAVARPGLGHVLADAGATFQDVVALIGAGGGAIVDADLIDGAGG
jgi:CheY-like chemotaxis protein